ncbi:MAG: ATP-dependent Clp protease ATP-binding subunit, partial [Streptococcaceae bacterium]|nr:ATP-dependent Clp protease ATP-binding subunit [Streptococcaceae bacterium]
MLCQNCNINEATIHLYTSVNGQKKQTDLCQNCYQIMKSGGREDLFTSAQSMDDPFSPFPDIFSALHGDQNEYTRPQTQSGGRIPGGPRQPRGNGKKDKGVLGEFGINITDIARRGEIDPVIGRDEEIVRVIEILNRRTKNNPVLIGEPGVGKTAVVEGLAQKIVDGDVPEKLKNKEVIRLDVVSLVQGTGVRGQFEERMQKLMDEIRKRKDVILFIDEIHELVGAGSAGEGNMDAGNILKPALARGELQLVGATTLNEYRIIEKDAALERRMQPVKVDEPSVDETITILKGIQKRYEDYHRVKYTDEAIETAAILSNRYIQDRFMPDKAIDLLDESGSKKNLTLKLIDPEDIKSRIDKAELEKAHAMQAEDFEKAAHFRDQITKLRELQNQEVSDDEIPVITEKDIEQIVEQKTHIPVGDLKEKEQTQL